MQQTPAPSGVISLLTDFGLSDPFVGIMHGVILGTFRSAAVVDLCHGIPPQSIAEGSFWLERSYVSFPPGSVHVAVVDPTVGSARRILALSADGHYFIAPDNGLLPAALLEHPSAELREVAFERLGIAAVSATFHGRDVFAPIAARLASGALAFSALGELTSAVPALLERPARGADGIEGVVVTVDRFGNLITNIERESLLASGARSAHLEGHAVPVRRTYADVEPGELLALINAFGVLEVAVRDGSAERRLGLGRWTRVSLPLASRPLRV